MYSNIPSRWAVELVIGDQISLVADTQSTASFTVQGLKKATMTLSSIMWVNQEADVDKAFAANPYISADNTLTLAMIASSSTVIAAGSKFRIVVEVCDNGFNANGLM